jgi:CRP-like cAMP-binding protein
MRARRSDAGLLGFLFVQDSPTLCEQTERLRRWQVQYVTDRASAEIYPVDPFRKLLRETHQHSDPLTREAAFTAGHGSVTNGVDKCYLYRPMRRICIKTTHYVELGLTLPNGCASMQAILQASQSGGVLSTTRATNRVLMELARADRLAFSQLLEQMEPFALQRGAVLGVPHVVSESVYFVEAGVVSLVAAARNGESVEVALVGNEGVAGFADALGSQPLPYSLVVQLPGLAYRAPKEVIREHILSCSSLHELLMDYSQRVMHQLAQSALCNRFHTSVQRLARWLLLTAERADTNRFELTHEFVAQMVGAPRPVVSESAATLRKNGTIEYRRGLLTIRNPKKLRKFACECFETISRAANGQPTIPRLDSSGSADRRPGR